VSSRIFLMDTENALHGLLIFFDGGLDLRLGLFCVLMLLLFCQGGIMVPAVVAADATAGFYFPGSPMAEAMQEDSPTPAARRGFSLFVTEGADSKRLWSQTRLVFVSGLVAAGIIYTMPSDVTGWDKDIEASELADKWWDNVSRRPVWDKDDWVINYVGHAYFGGVYYQVARKSGYNQWDSFVYTTLMSGCVGNGPMAQKREFWCKVER